jgi:hypothetical protein
MNLDITDEEQDFLRELLEEKHKRMIQEIDHTDTIDFERMLKEKLEVLEGLKEKVDSSQPASG